MPFPFKKGQTALLIPPTLDEIKREANVIHLPLMEAEAFFYYYESNGWRVGKNKMKCWRSALQGWRIRWIQKQRERAREPSEATIDRKTRDLLSNIKANKA